MKKIIPILLAIVLFASLSYAFTSPPGLLNKLDKMFEWTKRNMEVKNFPVEIFLEEKLS